MGTVHRCSASDVPRIFVRNCNLYSHVIIRKHNILPFVIRIRNTPHTGSSSTVLFNMCYVVFSQSSVLSRRVFTCRYMFKAMYSFVPFSWGDILSCAVTCHKTGSAAGERRLAEHCTQGPHAFMCNQLNRFQWPPTQHILLCYSSSSK
jgi:hypothetical protein